MAGRISGLAVFYATAGGVLLWSGLKGQTIADTVNAITSANPAALSQRGNETVGTPSVGIGEPPPTSTTQVLPANGSGFTYPDQPANLPKGGTPAANKVLGLALASAYGWSGSGEWPYLESGWEEESGWNQYAAYDQSDPYNHAYGIPQANPGTKMASAGSDWKTNPATQIRWGLGYIKATYGSPSRVPGWSPNGPTAGYVGY